MGLVVVVAIGGGILTEGNQCRKDGLGGLWLSRLRGGGERGGRRGGLSVLGLGIGGFEGCWSLQVKTRSKKRNDLDRERERVGREVGSKECCRRAG